MTNLKKHRKRSTRLSSLDAFQQQQRWWQAPRDTHKMTKDTCESLSLFSFSLFPFLFLFSLFPFSLKIVAWLNSFYLFRYIYFYCKSSQSSCNGRSALALSVRCSCIFLFYFILFDRRRVERVHAYTHVHRPSDSPSVRAELLDWFLLPAVWAWFVSCCLCVCVCLL